MGNYEWRYAAGGAKKAVNVKSNDDGPPMY